MASKKLIEWVEMTHMSWTITFDQVYYPAESKAKTWRYWYIWMRIGITFLNFRFPFWIKYFILINVSRMIMMLTMCDFPIKELDDKFTKTLHLFSHTKDSKVREWMYAKCFPQYRLKVYDEKSFHGRNHDQVQNTR